MWRRRCSATKLTYQTLDGDVALKVPAGTQSGQQFRLRHKGVPDMRSGDRGDQIVTIHVNIPGTLTEKQRDLISRVGGQLRPRSQSAAGRITRLLRQGQGRSRRLDPRSSADRPSSARSVTIHGNFRNGHPNGIRVPGPRLNEVLFRLFDSLHAYKTGIKTS